MDNKSIAQSEIDSKYKYDKEDSNKIKNPNNIEKDLHLQIQMDLNQDEPEQMPDSCERDDGHTTKLHENLNSSYCIENDYKNSNKIDVDIDVNETDFIHQRDSNEFV